MKLGIISQAHFLIKLKKHTVLQVTVYIFIPTQQEKILKKSEMN